jgi:hypothetical protein
MDLWIGVALLIFNVTLLALPKQRKLAQTVTAAIAHGRSERARR